MLSFLLLFLIPDCDRCFWSIIPWVQNALNLTTYQVLQWGSSAYLVAPGDLPLAFGILTGYANLVTCILPPLMGLSHDVREQGNSSDENRGKQSYLHVSLVFLLLSCFSLLLRISLKIWDRRKRRGLLESKNVG